MADRAAGAATSTQIDRGIVSRLATGIRFAFSGKSAEEFFGPGAPLAPAAQQAVEGRAFDYPTGYNINTQPRSGEQISFATLRGLADGYDLLRLAIETRKNQMVKLKAVVKPKDEKKKIDDRCKKIQEFLEMPDQEHDWDDWLRMWLEELFVTDAPAIYPRKTRGGEMYALEMIDGATIKRVLSADGRTPVPPDPAYQQVIKGVPGANYTREELYYFPRNVRTSRVYGYSPVEQIIMTVNIALRRQVMQLDYYTKGNIPPLLIGVPATWTPEQIEKFQKVWDLLLAGDLEKRQQARFVPGGLTVTELQKEEIFGAGDEWLARIVCYAMDLPPTAFVKQQNRATAGTAQEAALEEGLAPIMRYIERKMTRILGVEFQAPDLQFVWEDQKDVDPLVQAQIDKLYIDAGVDTPDEVREARGMEPLSEEQKAEIQAAKPAPPGALDEENGKPGAKPKSKKGNPDGVTAAAAEKFAQLVDHGIAPNLAKRLAGIDTPDIEGGDTPLVNAALVPLSAALEIAKHESTTTQGEG